MIITLGELTLADYTATPPIRAVIEDIGNEVAVQIAQRYNALNPFKAARGNAGGQVVFLTQVSQVDYNDATTYLKTMLAIAGTTDALILQPNVESEVLITYAGAICRSVKRVKWDGVRVDLRWVFETTTFS